MALEKLDKLRVLQFITPTGFYGAERWVLALANNIDHDHVICDLAVTKEGSKQNLSVATEYPQEAGKVHYLETNGRYDFSVINKLEKIINQRKIDVIHSHGYKSDILGLVAARKTGVKCISTPHGLSGSVSLKLKIYIRTGTFALRYFDAVAPLSSELLEDMQRFKVPKHAISFIRNGVDLKEIDSVVVELSKSNKGISKRKKQFRTIGYIGQLIPRKGIPDILHVFDQLYESDQSIKLQLIGDGSQRAELETMALQKASKNNIEFLGFRSDRLNLLSRLDLFVMTSSLEGIPRCMMEAMAVGVPVVAYNIPGVDQLIEHNKTGLLAPYGDKQVLMNCCKKLLHNSSLAKKLTTEARNRIEMQYSASRMAKEYELLYKSLLS